MSGLFIDKKLQFQRDGLLGYRMRNNHGSSISAGSVVIFDTTDATGSSVKMTTGADDALVMGVMMDTVANGDHGFVAIYGHISTLRANGTTAISVGDHLSTHTVAGVAAKATAGKAGKFAIALEAYSTADSNGVLDVWLTPAARGDNSALSSQLNNDVDLVFGTTDAAGTAVRMEYDTAETNDALKIGVNTASRRVIIEDYGDMATDTTLAAATNPTLTIVDAAATDYLHLATTTTVGSVDVSSGNTFDVLVAGTSEYSFSATNLEIKDGNSLTVGDPTPRTTDVAATFQVLGTAAADGAATIGVWNTTDATGPELGLLKSGNAAIGSFTIVANNENLGSLVWYADDGTDYATPAASIKAAVDGTPGANDMPARLVFSTTADGANAVTESFRVASDQNVYVGNNNGLIIGSTSQLTIGGVVGEAQIQGTGFADSSLFVGMWSAGATDNAFMGFLKSNNPTIGSFTIVTNGGDLGDFVWYADDGTDYATPSAAISVQVDGAPGVDDMPGRMIFSTTADGANGTSEVFRIASDQNIYVANNNGVVVGAAAQYTISTGDGSTALVPEAQVLGTAQADGSMLIGAWNTTDTIYPTVAFLKSGNAAIGSQTIVASGEDLGAITWYGDDGVDYKSPAAQIKAQVDATPGAGDMPGRLVFLTTTDGGETLTERARIDNAGNLMLGATSVGTGSPTKVFVVGNGTAPTSSPASTVTFYSSNNSASNTIPSFYCEGTDVLATGQADSASATRVKVRINGTVVTLLGI